MATSEIVTELNDFLRCAICNGKIHVPKTLPCLHNFCLRCIEQHVGLSKSTHQSQCPVCGETFAVDADVDTSLKTNYFLSNLITLYELHSNNEKPLKCEACDQNLSSQYLCMICQEVYCESCKNVHMKLRATKSHKIKPLEEVRSGALDELSKSFSSWCNKHLSQSISLFCRTCSVKMCLLCQLDDHKTHDCVSIEQKSKELKEWAGKSLALVCDKYQTTLNALEQLETKERNSDTELDGIRIKILDREKILIHCVKSYSKELQDELSQIKTKTSQEFERTKAGLKCSLKAFASVSGLTRKLLDYGSNADFIDTEDALKHSLQKFDQLDLKSSVPAIKAAFEMPCNHMTLVKEQFGSLHCQDATQLYIDQPKMLHVIPGDLSVVGIACLEELLYVVRKDSNWIEVFNKDQPDTFTIIDVHGLISPHDMASCDTNNCLYITNTSTYKRLYRVTPAGKVSQLTTPEFPFGVSITKSSNLLVTFTAVRLLIEFTSDGREVRRFALPDRCVNCWQAILLADDRLIICLDCFNIDERVIKQFESSMDSNVLHQGSVTQLSSDIYNNVFVVDFFKNRILLMSSDLSPLKTIADQQQGLERPLKIYYDKATGRLYVGLWNGEVRVLQIKRQ